MSPKRQLPTTHTPQPATHQTTSGRSYPTNGSPRGLTRLQIICYNLAPAL